MRKIFATEGTENTERRDKYLLKKGLGGVKIFLFFLDFVEKDMRAPCDVENRGRGNQEIKNTGKGDIVDVAFSSFTRVWEAVCERLRPFISALGVVCGRYRMIWAQ